MLTVGPTKAYFGLMPAYIPSPESLGAKLAQLQREQRRAELEAIAGPKTEVGWGQAFRHYVLAPYQTVKDDRTGHETGNVDAVLDGDLDPFMEAFLRWRRQQGDPSTN